jgi:adenine/guanine phosphoribosyltransferase-like PRPP-binding protein
MAFENSENEMDSLINGVEIANRLNNNCRPFVLIQEEQAKHVPVSPSRAIIHMESLGQLLKKKYGNRKCLIIGFAETATALSVIVANQISPNATLIHTTREAEHPFDKYFVFSEDHSHAKDQYLHKTMIDDVSEEIDCIILVDDEITTGKTAMRIIELLLERYSTLADVVIVVASLVNSMDDSDVNRFFKQGIRLEYLNHLDSIQLEINPDVRYEDNIYDYCSSTAYNNLSIFNIKGKANPRIGILIAKYMRECRKMIRDIVSICNLTLACINDLLVLGTEECMYPAIALGAYIEEYFPHVTVTTHSTTRSPIMPSLFGDYPIREGFRVNSFYDPNRVTYLYNIEKYDAVFIVTDSAIEIAQGLNSLSAALSSKTNEKIFTFVWSQ